MSAEAPEPALPAFIQEHDGDIFVFILAEGAAAQSALNVNTANGDIYIFSNCSGEMIEALRRHIAPGRTGNTRELSPQQRHCLDAAMQGQSTKQIAKELRLSPRTVDGHLRRCRERFGARTTLGAATSARQAGISVEPPPGPCPLTPRQLQCLRSIAQGAGAAAVAAELGISINGVNFHLKHARERLGVATTRAAVFAVIKAGWVGSSVAPHQQGKGA